MYSIAVIFVFALRAMAATQNECILPKDCYDLKCYGGSTAKDGPHTIYPGTTRLSSLQVSCDQETDDGGWTMYQRRVDGAVNFTNSWQDYKHGFGNNSDNTTELWLGNENVYQILQSQRSTEWELRIEADGFGGGDYWLVASNFRMDHESLRYSISWQSVSASSAAIAEQWNYHLLLTFKTMDNDDEEPGCVNKYKGGWWYGRLPCKRLFLNGRHTKYSMERSRMMFRPMNDSRSCSNPCKNGGTCEYNAAAKTTACKCVAEFDGPTCEGTPTKSSSSVTTAVVVGCLLLATLTLAGAIAGAVMLRRRKQARKQAAEETARRNRELAAQGAEQSGLFASTLKSLESLGQILHIWE